MRDYFIRRLLLIPPTLVGITLIVFFITRIVPGGPLEQAIAEMQMFSAQHGGSAGASSAALSESQIKELKAYYGFDKPWYTAYGLWLMKVLQGDLGTSYRYNEPVWDIIKTRFPISIFYGVLTVFLTYTLCIPLGILKAIKHRTWIDNASSITVFIGYAIPNYVLGSLLVVFLAARLEWFPMGGFVSDNFEELTAWGKVLDLIQHSTLPLICYLVGSFAFLTLLMKNNLMDHIAADYVRTAIAKGSSFKQAILKHAFRNSLIPIATNFGQNITLIFTGSFLIETIFDINGFGLLGYTSILDRDYPIVMGVLLLASILLLLGNILSDILVAIVDPRIRFQ
ncbi:MAG: ABC transporter permease subunit [Opitutales bacterium]